MQHSTQQLPGGSSHMRRLVWVLFGLVGILVVALVVAITILLTKPNVNSSLPSTSEPGVAANQHTQPPKNTQTPLATIYMGDSMNRTAQQLGLDGTAKLKLQFTNKDSLALRGEIVVDGRNVGGTGLFEGTLKEDRIQLNVLPRDGVPNFQLTGTVRADGSMDGVLTVPGSAGDIAQTGEWQLHPES